MRADQLDFDLKYKFRILDARIKNKSTCFYTFKFDFFIKWTVIFVCIQYYCYFLFAKLGTGDGGFNGVIALYADYEVADFSPIIIIIDNIIVIYSCNAFT